jgi:G3E family GTPase
LSRETRLPVTILTGFLGAGKTTLLNRLLTDPHGLRIAVVENEFGEIGIDRDLIVGASNGVFELDNGCICCEMKDDLLRTLAEILRRKDRIDAVVIETTGMADPSPIVGAFFADGPTAQGFRLDALVAVVDAAHVERRLEENREAVEQIAYADRVVLNKIDLVDAARADAVERRLRRIQPDVRILRASRCDVPLSEIFGVRAFDLAAAAEAALKSPDAPSCGEEGHAHGPSCGPHRESGAHEGGVSAVGVEIEGALDLDRVDLWLRDLLAKNEADMFRTKGVLNVAGSDRSVVFQAVHAVAEATEGKPWPEGSKRLSRVTFIGRNLDRALLLSGLEGCRTQHE